MELEAIEEADMAAAEAAVRRFLRRRVREPAVVDDITQETLLKVLDVRHRFQRAVSIPYAVTVAKHLLVARARSTAVAERHIHQLPADPLAPPPDELVLSRDDEAAMRAALRALPDDERSLLLAHVVDEADTASLAVRTGGTAGGVAAKLSRARARARVDYVVASTGATLPSEKCRPVLLSLSAADRRRQTAVGAAEHLVECGVCADLSPQLVERRRSIVGLLPLPIFARLVGSLRAFVRAHPVAAAGGAVGAIAVVTAAVVASAATPHHHRVVPTAAPRPTVSRARAPAVLDIRAVLPLSPPEQRHLDGRRVVARMVPIIAVPADEGFWIGDSEAHRFWVQLATHGESGVHVLAGHRASFTGRLVAHGPGFASSVGISDAEGRRELTATGMHAAVNVSALTTSR